MKPTGFPLKIYVIWGFILVLSQATADEPQRKRALLIGVCGYAREGNGENGWWELNTARDLVVIRSLLTGPRFGFLDRNIEVLDRPKSTGSESIVSALKRFSKTTQAGDVAFIYYSGHGQQIPDQNDDEEFDDYDESLVPSNYVSRLDSSRNIRDDTIGEIIQTIVQKKPANLTLVFDTCFSGTITKGGEHLVKGSSWSHREGSRSFAGDPQGSEASGILDNGGGLGFVALSASRYDRVASETVDDSGQEMGLLTFAFARAMASAGPRTTYRDLYEVVSDLVSERNAYQRPQIEGEIDQKIFDSDVLPPEPSILVKCRLNRLFLQAGWIHGITSGSSFDLFRQAEKNPKGAIPIAHAKVSVVDFDTSELTLDSADLKLSDFHLCRAIETEHAFRDRVLRLDATSLLDTERGAELLNRLEQLPVVMGARYENDWDIRISPRSQLEGTIVGPDTSNFDTSKWVFQRSDGTLLMHRDRSEWLTTQVDLGGGFFSRARAALEREARWLALKSLSNESATSSIKIKLRVEPVRVRLNESNQVVGVLGPLDESRRSEGGELELREGDRVELYVRNTGSMDAFVCVIDLTPEGEVGPLVPHPKVQTNREQFRVSPSEEWTKLSFVDSGGVNRFVFKIEVVSERPETFRVIATDEFVDFTPLFDPAIVRGAPKSASPLAELLRAAIVGQRATIDAVDPRNWDTDSVTFRVLPVGKE